MSESGMGEDGTIRAPELPEVKKIENDEIAERLRQKRIFVDIIPDRNNPRLNGMRQQIEDVAYPTLATVADELELVDTGYEFYDHPGGVIPEVGIGGAAGWGRHFSPIQLYINPASPNLDVGGAFADNLRRILRHESLHTREQMALGREFETIDERMITEGKAQWYETEGTQGEPPLWATALDHLNRGEQDALLAKIRNLSDTSMVDWEAYMFGATKRDIPRYTAYTYGLSDRDIPRWSAYALGYRLVGEYLDAHPEQKASTIYAVPAEEFIKSN